MGLSIVGNVPNERSASANNLVMYLMNYVQTRFYNAEIRPAHAMSED